MATDAQINQMFANVEDWTDAEIAGDLSKLTMLAEDINGPNTFSLESAAYGYIERHHRLILPTKLFDDIKSIAQLSIVDLFTIAFYNYTRLRSGGMKDSDAYFVAMYRARLISNGYLYVTKEDRAVTIDEVDWVPNLAAFHADLREEKKEYKEADDKLDATDDEAILRLYLKYANANPFRKFVRWSLLPDQQAIIKHLVFTADQYAASTYLVFRQHGHHYKQEFDSKYDVLWKATTIEQSPSYPGNEIIHRIAIHSFGVKTLHVNFHRMLSENKLAETFVDRADVAPSGTAIVATCWAAINLMRSLPIWTELYAAYGDRIDLLQAEAQKLKVPETAIDYHKNAKLFGRVKRRINTDVAASLAPIAKGFIEAMGEGSDLSRQKALDKRANQNPVVVNTINNVIIRIMTSVARTGDMSMITGKAPKRIRAEPAEEIEEEEAEV